MKRAAIVPLLLLLNCLVSISHGFQIEVFHRGDTVPGDLGLVINGVDFGCPDNENPPPLALFGDTGDHTLELNAVVECIRSYTPQQCAYELPPNVIVYIVESAVPLNADDQFPPLDEARPFIFTFVSDIVCNGYLSAPESIFFPGTESELEFGHLFSPFSNAEEVSLTFALGSEQQDAMLEVNQAALIGSGVTASALTGRTITLTGSAEDIRNFLSDDNHEALRIVDSTPGRTTLTTSLFVDGRLVDEHTTLFETTGEGDIIVGPGQTVEVKGPQPGMRIIVLPGGTVVFVPDEQGNPAEVDSLDVQGGTVTGDVTVTGQLNFEDATLEDSVVTLGPNGQGTFRGNLDLNGQSRVIIEGSATVTNGNWRSDGTTAAVEVRGLLLIQGTDLYIDFLIHITETGIVNFETDVGFCGGLINEGRLADPSITLELFLQLLAGVPVTPNALWIGCDVGDTGDIYTHVAERINLDFLKSLYVSSDFETLYGERFRAFFQSHEDIFSPTAPGPSPGTPTSAKAVTQDMPAEASAVSVLTGVLIDFVVAFDGGLHLIKGGIAFSVFSGVGPDSELSGWGLVTALFTGISSGGAVGAFRENNNQELELFTLLIFNQDTLVKIYFTSNTWGHIDSPFIATTGENLPANGNAAVDPRLVFIDANDFLTVNAVPAMVFWTWEVPLNLQLPNQNIFIFVEPFQTSVLQFAGCDADVIELTNGIAQYTGVCPRLPPPPTPPRAPTPPSGGGGRTIDPPSASGLLHEDGKGDNTAIIALPVALVGAFLLLVAIGLALFFYRRRSRQQPNKAVVYNEELVMVEDQPTVHYANRFVYPSTPIEGYNYGHGNQPVYV